VPLARAKVVQVSAAPPAADAPGTGNQPLGIRLLKRVPSSGGADPASACPMTIHRTRAEPGYEELQPRLRLLWRPPDAESVSTCHEICIEALVNCAAGIVSLIRHRTVIRATVTDAVNGQSAGHAQAQRRCVPFRSQV
jgi:hypothetical protein